MIEATEVAQKLTEVEAALASVASTLEEVVRRTGSVMVDDARDGVIESQARLVLLVADLSQPGLTSPGGPPIMGT